MTHLNRSRRYRIRPLLQLINLGLGMEESDAILFLALRQAGCPISEDTTYVSQLETASLFSLCSHCLRVITGQSCIAMDLSKGTAARFRLCADVAMRIQQLGYRGELSFHQVLSLKATLKVDICVHNSVWAITKTLQQLTRHLLE